MKNLLLEKTFRVLELAASAEKPVSLKQLSEATAIPPSTLSRIAADLVEAGYLSRSGPRRFEPAPGLILLGQNALYNSPLPHVANPLIRSRAESLGVNGALAGMQNSQLVYLYRSDLYGLDQINGMPCRVPPGRSYIALAILVMENGADEGADRFLQLESRRLPEAQVHHLAASVAEHGYLHQVEENGCWNICFPIEYRRAFYGISLYGRKGQGGSPDRLLFEAALLTSKIRNALS